MSSRAEFTPALSCQDWAWWQVPGCMPIQSMNPYMVIGPNHRCIRGRDGLSMYFMYGLGSAASAPFPSTSYAVRELLAVTAGVTPSGQPWVSTPAIAVPYVESA